MKVQTQNQTQLKNSPAFKSFYRMSAELEKNIPLSRGVIDIFGSDIPWLIMANNKQERWEKARRMTVVFVLCFLSPIAVLPVFNRIGMKYGSKLVKSVWSDNHKAIHLSNKNLVNVEKMKEGLKELSNKYENGPIEDAYRWIRKNITGKEIKQKSINYEKMVENIKTEYKLNDEQAWEKLRQKLINTKNGVMSADYLFSSISLGSVGFVNNLVTKKKTGQSGFSAEFSMADKSLVEKRAEDYEKSWKKRYAVMLAGALTLGLGIPFMVKKGMSSQGKNAIKNCGHWFDYSKGIYMSRLSLLLGNLLICHGGALLANRNKTELKDNALRFGMADALFFGGDVVVGSVLGRMISKMKGIELIDSSPENKKRLMPRVKEMSKIADPKEKRVACGLYWLNLAIIAASMGFVVPAIANKITRKDVKKDIEKHNLKFDNNTFFKNNIRQSEVFKNFIV